MEIAGIPVRDVVVGVCIVIAIYVAVTMLRLMRLRRHKASAEESPPRVLPKLDLDLDVGDDEHDADAGDDLVYSRPVAPPAPPPVQQQAAEPPRFEAELGRSQLEREVRQLREEVSSLRAELEEMKAASRVSPQYADAMALAQRGLTAQDVADRCGISLAEAELVWALARGPQDTEQEDEYGGEPGRNPAGPRG